MSTFSPCALQSWGIMSVLRVVPWSVLKPLNYAARGWKDCSNDQHTRGGGDADATPGREGRAQRRKCCPGSSAKRGVRPGEAGGGGGAFREGVAGARCTRHQDERYASCKNGGDDPVQEFLQPPTCPWLYLGSERLHLMNTSVGQPAAGSRWAQCPAPAAGPHINRFSD